MKDLNEKIEKWDEFLVLHARRWAVPFSRFAIFLVYFWFGALKVFSISPASPLVYELLNKTLHGVSFGPFLAAFGVFEMVIGIVFLISGLERLGMFLMFVHLLTTILPLFVLPHSVWQGFMMPTLEGQYIIKNILLAALALVVLAHVHRLKNQNK